MSGKIDLDLDAWGSLDWDEELEKANSQQSQDLEVGGPSNSGLASSAEVKADREDGFDIEDCNDAIRLLGSTCDPSNIDPKLEIYSRERDSERSFHPGWVQVTSPPLETSNHSTAPEVMRWVRSPYIQDSIKCHFDKWENDLRPCITLHNAQALVDFDIDLSAYKFPFGASGKRNPLPPPFPRRWSKPLKARRREAETLEYTASDIRAIERNVRLQLLGPQMSPEIREVSESEPDSEGCPSSKSDSGYDGDTSRSESTGEACLQDSGVGFGTDPEETNKSGFPQDAGCIII